MTCSSHELVIIYNHREPLGRVLPDERLDKRECLAAARSSYYPCASKTVAYRNPSLAELSLVIVSHGDVHTVFVLDFLLALFKTFILEIEPVLHQAVLGELRDVVQRDMHQYHPREGCRHVENDVQGQRVEPYLHRVSEQPYRQGEQQQAARERVHDLRAGVALQVLVVPGSKAGDADKQYRGELAVHEVPVVVYHPLLDTSVDIAEYAVPVVQHRRVDGILEKLHQHGEIHCRAEYVVESL